MIVLQNLVRRAVELYGSDVLAPSIVTSWLPDKLVWYVSVVRWRGSKNELTRQVLTKATGADLEEVYAEVLRRLP